jgi:hypothetical protein
MINQSAAIDKLLFILKVPSADTPIDTDKVITHARENLADTVAPFRWSQEQLAEFVNGGLTELRVMRSDVASMPDVPEQFTSPIANYVVCRALALDNDAQNNNGALSDKYYTFFAQQAAAVQYFFTREKLGKYLDDAVTELTSVRPDLRIADDGSLKETIRQQDQGGSVRYDLPEKFLDVIVCHAAYNACQQSSNSDVNFYLDKFQGAWKTI